ncbi:MAG TPA: hypothetical protein VM933_05345, partial [Acidimicrobiales bacterium]|nr:hypothetical protein [Acidimicrobiales bacterium]
MAPSLRHWSLTSSALAGVLVLLGVSIVAAAGLSDRADPNRGEGADLAVTAGAATEGSPSGATRSATGGDPAGAGSGARRDAATGARPPGGGGPP